MDSTNQRIEGGDAFRRMAEVALAGLLHDVGKIFQRAEWPLSQAAEKLQEDLCPVMDGRAVHRHVLWTYDFCSDNLKWLADYVDLARVVRLATGHHKAAHDDPAALILDAADRIAAGAEAVEVEELQPVIPPQVPLESVLWSLGEGAREEEAAPLKSRRRRRSGTSEAAAEQQMGRAGEGETGRNDNASGEEAAERPAATGEGAEFVTPQVTDQSGRQGEEETRGNDGGETRIDTGEPGVVPGTPANDSGVAPGGTEHGPRPAIAGAPRTVAPGDSTVAPGESKAASLPPHSIFATPANNSGVAPGSALSTQDSGPPPSLPRFDTVRRGFFKAQVLRSDEDVLPAGKRPDMDEKDYRELGTDLIGAVQKIGRMTGRPRLEWLVEALRGVLEARMSLVPAYVGSGGQLVSLYSHAAAMSAVAAALWQGYERTGMLAAQAGAKTMSLTLVQVMGTEEYLCRPAATENSARVYHGRAALVRLITRLLGDVLLRDMGLLSISRLWESDDSVLILGQAGEQAASAIERFVAEQGAKISAQTGGYLRLAATEPVEISYEQFGGAQWPDVCRELSTKLTAAKVRVHASVLQSDGHWREEAAVLNLADRHGQALPAGEWARLQEAYERQLGMNLAKGKAIAAYSSPVTPAGVEGEPTAIGPWFVHVAAGAEALAGTEGLEQIYSVGQAEEPWAWVPAWRGLPHGPSYRRADESQLRADGMPDGWQMAAGTKRRDSIISFEELGWLARRSRKARGFVGRSWLSCLRLEADGLCGGWGELVRRAENLGQVVEIGRQGQWFWQGFVEGQLRRSDRATWRVFVLRSSLGGAILVGPWNTMMVLAGRAEQWWRRWAGPDAPWLLRGAMALGARDVPAWQLAWQAAEGLIEADPAEGQWRLWVLGRARSWTSYREALRLATLLDEQIQAPELQEDDRGLTLLRRLLGHVRRGQRVSRHSRVGTAWRAELAMDVRKLVLRHAGRRGERTAGQDEFITQLQSLITAGRRGKLPANVGLAARIAVWQNQGETS